MKKNIYDILNDVEYDISDLKREEINDIEKKNILNAIKKHDAKEKSIKMKKRRLILTSAAALVAISLVSSNVRESIAIAAENIVSTIAGNSKNDFAEEINEKTEADGVKLSLDKVIREDNEIKVRYKISFNEDISSFKDLGSDQLFKRTSVFYSDAFEKCNIYLNDNKLSIDHDDNSPDKVNPVYDENGYLTNEDELSDYLKNKPSNEENSDKELSESGIWFYEVNDISINDNEIEQELVIFLNNYNYTKNLDIKLQFNEIKVGDKVLKGPWEISYNMKNGEYNNDIEKTPLNINAKTSNGSTLNINGYSISNTGLKIYAKDTTCDEVKKAEIERIISLYPDVATNDGEKTKNDIREYYKDEKNVASVDTMPIIRFVVTDDLGNKYLFYPKYFDGELKFSIYDGPADIKKEYKDYFDEKAKSITLALYEEVVDWNTYEESYVKLTDDITINLNK